MINGRLKCHRLEVKTKYFNFSQFWNLHKILLLVLLLCHFIKAEEDVTFNSPSNEENELTLHQIEGRVTPPDPKPSDWYWSTRILIDGGKKLAFIKVITSISCWKIAAD